LWTNYIFQTSNKEILVNHLKQTINDILSFKKIKKNEFILDIGSNDGTLLNFFKLKKFTKFLGIDPAKNLVKIANNKNINTMHGYMNLKNSNIILKKYGKAQLVTAFNVFAHTDNLAEMLRSVKNVLSKDGIFVLEVSYLLDIIKKNLVGTIFHEHLSYHSVISLKNFFNKYDMKLIQVLRVSEQGGSIICYVQHNEGNLKIKKNVSNIIGLEIKEKINKLSTYQKFSNRLNRNKDIIYNYFKKLDKRKLTISAFGASISSTTLLHSYRLGKFIKYIYDDNLTKVSKFSPGYKIKILHTSRLYSDKPDYLLILAWMEPNKIMKKTSKYFKSGGKFLTIYPSLKIIQK
tara:strand:+ start:1619 stop:2659 length:1041 start_codon:yes stop_codon:yes gene_type:complete